MKDKAIIKALIAEKLLILIVAEAKPARPDAIGLSALMTTTIDEYE